jgi:hypothetical protein
MNDLSSSSPTVDSRYSCPQCHQPLRLEGHVVNTGTYKKWVDEWRCPEHGAIDLSPPLLGSEQRA